MSEARRSWDEEADVIVVGSGSAALAAALAAAVGGARVIVLEKAAMLGGTSAMSGAGTWVPANHHMLAAGIADSPTEALTYLRATAPAGWHEEEDSLWQAFVEKAPAMLEFLEAHTPLRFELVHHPDLYVEAPGGKFTGRMVSPLPLSRNLAGPWHKRIRRSTMPQIFTYRELITGTVVSQPVRTLLKWAPRLLYRLLTRRVGMGNALVVGLIRGCLDNGCVILAETRARRLLTDGDGAAMGRVIGVEAERRGRRLALRAAKGVVLATGGFEWDPEMRARHFPGEEGLMGSPRTNTGDGHKMAEAVGARLARMDQANIYAVTTTIYEGKRHALPLNELYHPHCILVNRHGRRFVNEGDPNVGVVLDTRDAARPPRSDLVSQGADARRACAPDRPRRQGARRDGGALQPLRAKRPRRGFPSRRDRLGEVLYRRSGTARLERCPRHHRASALLRGPLLPRHPGHQGRSAHRRARAGAAPGRQPNRRALLRRRRHGQSDRHQGGGCRHHDRALPHLGLYLRPQRAAREHVISARRVRLDPAGDRLDHLRLDAEIAMGCEGLAVVGARRIAALEEHRLHFGRLWEGMCEPLDGGGRRHLAGIAPVMDDQHGHAHRGEIGAKHRLSFNARRHGDRGGEDESVGPRLRGRAGEARRGIRRRYRAATRAHEPDGARHARVKEADHGGDIRRMLGARAPIVELAMVRR